jgi:hypothetical protein
MFFPANQKTACWAGTGERPDQPTIRIARRYADLLRASVRLTDASKLRRRAMSETVG